jgi:uncharacterized protein (DUF2249 family)
MPESIRELDVRPILRAGGEPYQAIMQAVDALPPGGSLRLLATFRPVPLFTVMANRGFAARDQPLGQGDWEVVFTPVAGPAPETGLATGSSASAMAWPDPATELDLTGLEPPEPMVRILETLEGLAPGQTLFALLAREPVFLFPELAKREHEWAGNFDAEGVTYRLLVRHGGRSGHAAGR